MVEHEPERPLSPELVLVSPDLRERALLDELDSSFPEHADVDPPTASVEPAPQAPAPQVPAAPPQAALPRTEAATPRVERRRLTAGALTAIALTALIVFGAGLAVGKLAFPGSSARSPAAPRDVSQPPPVTTAVPRTSSRASTTPPPASTTRSQTAPRAVSPRPPVTTAVPRTSSRASTTPPRASRTRSQTAPRAVSPRPPVTTAAPRTSSSATPTVPAKRPRPSTAPSPAKKLPSKGVRPIPNGGYVFSDGRFRLAGTGRRILDFTLQTACSGPLTLPQIQVAANGTFGFSGHPPGTLPGTSVRVTGRFVSPVAARGTTRVTRGTCRGPARPFAARLS